MNEVKQKPLLIFVHGRDFKPAANEFMDLCEGAIAAGVSRDIPELADQFYDLEKQLAYYGDITHDFLVSEGQEYDEVLDVGDRRNALVRLKSFDRKKQFGVARYDRLPGKNALTEFAADIAAPLLGRLGFSRKLFEKVGIDLAEYWNRNSNFAESIRQRVRDVILAALEDDRHILLISHGTGCIVTYDVLWQLSHDEKLHSRCEDRKIDLWLTLGAPLGDSNVRRRLLGTRKKGMARFPRVVVSWHNVAAEDDFVSHDNTLADDFRDMLKQKQVSCIRDYRIYNLAVRYGRSNPHSSIGYLIHPKTIQIIGDWLELGSKEPMPKSIF